jgi:hypothetical protein
MVDPPVFLMSKPFYNQVITIFRLLSVM